MLGMDNFDFSFSGLKTAVLYHVQKTPSHIASDPTFVAGVCHAFQEAVVDVLVGKTKKALIEYTPKHFVIAGGVSANIRLRTRLEEMIQDEFPEVTFLTPPFKYSLDNAAMIGAAAIMRYEQLDKAEREKSKQHALTLDPHPNLPFKSLSPTESIS
jgi:N6-L-threonylcarbamoyladenine synthase